MKAGGAACLALWLAVAHAEEDLAIPEVTNGAPAPGLRVKQWNDGFEGTGVYHLLYLPTDWEPGGSYPVIFEYPGNQYQTSPGTVEGCELGYGISGGQGTIWVCLPFVVRETRTHALKWWGDADATAAYCKQAVDRICAEYGGDRDRLFLAGFSRGAIACNFIGLRDEEIAGLWRGFICHSHYDGVKPWPYEGSDRKAALERLKRLAGRPQFISHELSVETTRTFLSEAAPEGDFTFLPLPFPDHTSSWVLADIPERATLREWFRNLTEPH